MMTPEKLKTAGNYIATLNCLKANGTFTNNQRFHFFLCEMGPLCLNNQIILSSPNTQSQRKKNIFKSSSTALYRFLQFVYNHVQQK